MDTSYNTIKARPEQTPVAFRKIVCGIDGSPAALEGARQAAALAAPESTIELVAVANEVGLLPGPWEPTELRPEQALEEASAVLAGSAPQAVTRSVDSEGRLAWDVLLEAAAGADLLVLGRHSFTRAEGIVIGGMTAYVLNRAELPVLVAVKPPHGLSFPGRIVVGADGPGHPEDAVRRAADITQRFGSDVILVRVNSEHRPARAEIAEAVAELTKATGTQPIEIVADGRPHHAIASCAAGERASLVITGSRGMTFVEGLRSVSERVAQSAPCSGLVLRSADAAARDIPYA
jgi:nucleotide-binding universal stress UspA family protein